MDLFFLAISITSGLLATVFGGLFIFMVGSKLHSRYFDLANATAAGLMLAASIFSLLIPGLELGGTLRVVTGFTIGMLFILLLKDRVHVFYYKITGSTATSKVYRSMVIFIALTLHNMPEGMAVGVAFASGDIALGLEVAIAIGIQNIPEGFAVAAPILATGEMSRRDAFKYSIYSGIVEPINAVFAYFLARHVLGLLPYMFGFCAGAMMFVVINEMIPEAQHGEYFDKSTLAILLGFLIMFILDTTL